jgi:hypothetical protein
MLCSRCLLQLRVYFQSGWLCLHLWCAMSIFDCRGSMLAMLHLVEKVAEMLGCIGVPGFASHHTILYHMDQCAECGFAKV